MLLNHDEEFRILHGDCITEMDGMPSECIDLAIYSPPFPAVYAYQSSPADIGNSEDKHEAKLHFSFFLRSIIRLMKPGRVMLVHCQDIVRQKRAGGEGVFDFKGFLVRLGERAGFIHDYTWGIRKGPQSQAIRTKSRQLQFAGLESDRAQSRGAIPDHLIKFRKPGLNAVPINSQHQVSRDDWIKFAEYCWDDIRETDTLNVDGSKGPDDTKHICALQKGLIERGVKLFSNPGELVMSPFCGIGSEGFCSLKLGRKFVGIELKDEYYRKAIENCERAIRLREESQKTLFDLAKSE